MTNETKLLGFTPAGPGAVEERWQHVEVEVMDWDRVDDRQALKTWLDSYAHGPATTLRNVTKEAERFLLWMEHKHGENTRLLPLATIKDANGFLDYLNAPYGLPKPLLERHGRAKQPIAGPLARSSIRQAIVVLHRMFEALRNLPDEAGKPYILFNPWKLVKDGATTEEPSEFDEVEAAFSEEEWAAVQETIELLPQNTAREQLHYARSRWIMQLMYRTWLRRETVANLTMADFQQTQHGWIVRVVGKGGKKSKLVATSQLMQELRAYRVANGLLPEPGIGEVRPAVLPIVGSGALTGQAIYLICKTIFAATADRMEELSPVSAQRLRSASPHWMRHTGITAAMEAHVDPRYVQAQAQHSSLKITNRYDHKRRQNWRDQMESMG